MKTAKEVAGNPGSITLRDLLAPTSLECFLKEYWESKPLHNTGIAQAVEFPVLSLSDVEKLVATQTIADPNWLEVRKAGSPPPSVDDYSTKSGLVSAKKVFQFFRSGYSIILSKVHRRVSPIGRLCRNVEEVLTSSGVIFSDRVGSHLYLTPANAQAVLPHYDNLNVIALQAQGAKKWRLYEMLEEFPVDAQKGEVSRQDLPRLLGESILQSGQLLYIPRGFYHEASASNDLSLHITLDLYTKTWADLISEIARSVPALRQTLRHASENDFVIEYSARLKSLTSVSPEKVATDLVMEFFHGLDPLPQDGFFQINQISRLRLSTRVQRRAGAFGFIAKRQSQVQFIFPGGGFGGPKELFEVFQFLLQKTMFRVRDLPFLADAGKLQIVRELVKEGFLRRSE